MDVGTVNKARWRRHRRQERGIEPVFIAGEQFSVGRKNDDGPAFDVDFPGGVIGRQRQIVPLIDLVRQHGEHCSGQPIELVVEATEPELRLRADHGRCGSRQNDDDDRRVPECQSGTDGQRHGASR